MATIRACKSLCVLLAEGDGTGFGIHGIHDGNGFQMIAQVADPVAAVLEALFDGDAAALYACLCILHNGDQALQCAAVCQEVVDDQHMVIGRKKLLGHNDPVGILVGEGFHLGNVGVAIDIDGLGLFGEDHRDTEFPGNRNRDGNAGGFDGQNLCDLLVAEAALEFPSDFIEQLHIHLMIQKSVHLQHIAGFDDAVLQNSLLLKVHNHTSPI